MSHEFEFYWHELLRSWILNMFQYIFRKKQTARLIIIYSNMFYRASVVLVYLRYVSRGISSRILYNFEEFAITFRMDHGNILKIFQDFGLNNQDVFVHQIILSFLQKFCFQKKWGNMNHQFPHRRCNLPPVDFQIAKHSVLLIFLTRHR